MSKLEQARLKRRLLKAKTTLADLEHRVEGNWALAGYVMFWQGQVLRLQQRLAATPAQGKE